MRPVLLLILLIAFQWGFGHDPNEAFFHIVQQNDKVEVTAEFPWSMRDALLIFKPSLEEATQRSTFEEAFRQYLATNLLLIDKRGNPLSIQSIHELEQTGHGHENSFLIVFNGSGFSEIQNTIMFNVFENQINHHTVDIEGNQMVFTTTPSNQSSVITPKSGYGYLTWLVVLILAVGGKLYTAKVQHQKKSYEIQAARMS